MAKAKSPEEVIAEQAALIAELNAKLTSKEKAAATGKKTITIGKEEYQVISPKFRHNGEVRTVEELATDETLASEILKIAGQNIVISVKDAEAKAKAEAAEKAKEEKKK